MWTRCAAACSLREAVHRRVFKVRREDLHEIHTESFTTSLYGVMHECGHALYELNTDDGLQFTCLGTGASTGAHECSARFYENIIGRSMAWTEHMWPVLTENIPELGDYSPRELFRAVNAVRRTPLRTQADEAGYCLHIALRFEIERSLFDGGIGIHDAPALWNELTRRYLYCEARSDAEGILQDSHWCSGSSDTSQATPWAAPRRRSCWRSCGGISTWTERSGAGIQVA